MPSDAPPSIDLRAEQPDPLETTSRLLAESLRRILADVESVRLAIPGGSALAAVAGAREQLGRDWSRVRLTWVDERCVPVEDVESNRGAALRRGLLRSTDDDGRARDLHTLPLFLDGESAAQAVRRVAAALKDDFAGALDVVLLGMGEDGHIASLFPPHRPATGPDLVTYVPDSPKPPAARISLTRRLLETARHTLLLATGEAKRSALERLVAGDPQLPAHGLPGLVLVSDQTLSLPPALPSGSGSASPTRPRPATTRPASATAGPSSERQSS